MFTYHAYTLFTLKGKLTILASIITSPQLQLPQGSAEYMCILAVQFMAADPPCLVYTARHRQQSLVGLCRSDRVSLQNVYTSRAQLSESLGESVGGLHEACHDLARALGYELLHPLYGHLIALTKPQLLLHGDKSLSCQVTGRAGAPLSAVHG